METLVFNKRFIEPILSGKVTVTRRAWKRQLVKEGSVQSFMWKYIKDGVFCKAQIVKVERGKLGEVNELDARKEGFDSLQAFKDYFGKKWNPKLKVWVIRFEVIREITEF
jgi:hypothetical protein